MRGVFGGVLLILVAVGGWLLGSFYPAPPPVMAIVGQQARELRLEAESVDWQALLDSLPKERMDALRQEASQAAAAAGEAILVEAVSEEEYAETQSDAAGLLPSASTPAPAAAGAPSSASDLAEGFEANLTLCPRLTVANAPAAGQFAPIVNVNGVAVAANPTRGACLSSGFGARGRGLHKGLDYHSDTGGPILAAADGVVLERKYRDDYGNMLLLDHGGGVYTRYAHLSSFASGVVIGARVKQGQQIGLMGNTAAYRIPIHLHYELLTGDYANPKGSFGLKPVSPFSFPKAG